jgi:hypothetical protein
MLETTQVDITISRHYRALHEKQSVLYNANYVANFERIYIYSLKNVRLRCVIEVTSVLTSLQSPKGRLQ